MKALSFYVHIPYCIKRCGYCDFNTYTPSELREDATLESVSGDYIDAVLREVDIAHQRAPGSVPTIFFGGGTPSLLPARDLGRVISAIGQRWELAPDCEITLEANPDSVDEEKLSAFLEAGFNRISFGMQSALPHVLAVLDRTHNPENVFKAVAGARSAGFTSVSVDLIYGTPGESLQDWNTTVASALSLGVDHLSAYALIVETGTKLAGKIKRGELSMPNDDVMADMYLLIDSMAQSAGMSWYELSNWSKPGHESQHNIAYWKSAHWWGLGPGAHSHLDGVRWWNVKHPTAYKSALFGGTSPIQEQELLTQEQIKDEEIMLSIRMCEGVSLSKLSKEQSDRIIGYCDTGHLDAAHWQAGTLQLTPQGRLIVDRIVRELACVVACSPMPTARVILISVLALIFLLSGLAKASGNPKGLSGTRDVKLSDGLARVIGSIQTFAALGLVIGLQASFIQWCSLVVLWITMGMMIYYSFRAEKAKMAAPSFILITFLSIALATI